jgi:P4 family phage/plasmid primase-like protien
MIYKNICTFFEQIMPNCKVRKYLLRLLASNLHGENRDQLIHIWTGSGSNGKSILDNLLKLALGDYCDSLPIAALLYKRGASNAASPEIARLRGKRCVTAQEPDDDAKINTGIMKEITGDTTIYARHLNQNGFTFRPQFKLHLQCNKLPEISAQDGGTWRRIRVIDFPSKFVLKPKEKNEFPIDMSLSRKIKEWGDFFSSLLILHYKYYKKNGLDAPDEVLMTTTTYKLNNDVVGQYLKEHLEFDVDPKSKLKCSITEVYRNFKIWFGDGGGSGKPPKRVDMKEYMEKKYGKMKPYGWHLRYITSVGDDDDDDENAA